ncbi:hypothetical protein EXT68_19640 [Pectobacterium parmentieri]|uniref:Uncharacterized protein n=1 Tax=Pectobacterium parmentieri TaxID=1905730 RepID=A0A0H3I5B1_PECPM|nr:hypothetical protein [Pectobacterium parmentieri]AFI89110.1 Hypothetical protein W5S_0992 [Pectobacterium parmentieri]MBI0470207.1 hypothetical protein [Pectobacterium parmentieri]MBI0492807.1 hypothetical protein [Pectobacterium parmentieri]MBI0553670.1 hypothetical protein [Pectobacterium parmentieri]MBI0567084.1 hypothetical protein [Pectobacterium parmentieri]
MKISDCAKKRLKDIDWFANVSAAYDSAFYRVVNVNDFISSITSNEWENTTLEARNEITGFLARKHTVIYQEWNKLTREASGFVDESIIPLIPKINGVDMDVIFVNLKWDLVGYLVEDAYKDKLRSALFFNELTFIYERGHIPCGWDGVWPNGNLVIY